MIMMGPNKKKGTVALIMRKLEGKGDSYDSMKHEQMERLGKVSNEDGAESDYSNGYDAAASDMIKAFHDKDPKKLRSSLKSFIQMCLNEKE